MNFQNWLDGQKLTSMVLLFSKIETYKYGTIV